MNQETKNNNSKKKEFPKEWYSLLAFCTFDTMANYLIKKKDKVGFRKLEKDVKEFCKNYGKNKQETK